jgi:colanic acid/amylovoran biosynthesis protein
MVRTIGIIGVTISGNMGGQAMLEATLEHMRLRCPGARFVLFSVYPLADREQNRHPDLEVVAMPPWRLLTIDLLAALLIYLLRNAGIDHLVAPVLPRLFQRVADCDLMIDLTGISFVDRRGLLLLLYNLAVCMPSFATGTPHHKLSQALGPFETRLNRRIAKFVLKRCATVVARGLETAHNLQRLGFNNPSVLPDVSFAMTTNDDDRAQGLAFVQRKLSKRDCIVVSPSRVVERICSQRGCDYQHELSIFCRTLCEDGYGVLILPHSLRMGYSKNNDVLVAKQIAKNLADLKNCALLIPPPSARLIRGIFASCRFVITSRFHAAVGAVSVGVPVITIGWGHKYHDLLQPFGLDSFIVPAETLNASRLGSAFDRIREHETELRSGIASVLPAHKVRAIENFNKIIFLPDAPQELSERSER